MSEDTAKLLGQELVTAHEAYRTGDYEASYESYQQLAEHFTSQNQLPNARFFYERFLQVAKEHNWTEGQAAAHTNLGMRQLLLAHTDWPCQLTTTALKSCLVVVLWHKAATKPCWQLGWCQCNKLRVPRVLAGMLAEQLGNLQDAEEHYEQHLTLADLQPAPDGHGPEWVAAYANVMKVYMAPTLAFQQPGVIIIGIFAFV